MKCANCKKDENDKKLICIKCIEKINNETKNKKIKFEWEYIGGLTSRAKVIGGWIINHRDTFEQGYGESMVFVSDPNHKWEIENE